MKLTPGFDFSECGYDLSSDELAFLITEQYPHLVHGVDFWCMHYVKENSPERLSPSVIVDWKPEDIPEPTFEDIRGLEAGSTGLSAFKTSVARMYMFKPLSPRSLWLAALGLGIEKQDVLDTVAALEDEDLRKRYTIELTEPPSTGYYRDSESMEHIRELMGIPAAQFDDVWLWAQEG